MKLKHLLRPVHYLLSICTGIIYRGKGFKVTIDGMVIISDGKSSDMIPLCLASQKFNDKVNKHLKSYGYK